MSSICYEKDLPREQIEEFTSFFKEEEEKENSRPSEPKIAEVTTTKELEDATKLKPEDIPKLLPKQEGSDAGRCVSDNALLNMDSSVRTQIKILFQEIGPLNQETARKWIEVLTILFKTYSFSKEILTTDEWQLGIFEIRKVAFKHTIFRGDFQNRQAYLTIDFSVISVSLKNSLLNEIGGS